MSGLRTTFLSFLVVAGLVVAGIVWATGSPYQPQPIQTGAAGKRQPKPSASDGTYLYVTVSWEQGKTAAVSITAGSTPIPSGVDSCDVVCTVSPSKFSIQVRRGDRVILSVVATARWGRVFCSLRRVGERDAQLVKPAKNTGLEGQVVCEQTAR